MPDGGAGMVILSETQVRIMVLLEKGRSNREIGVALHLSVAGIEYHMGRLFQKTGATSRVSLALWWREYRQVNPFERAV